MDTIYFLVQQMMPYTIPLLVVAIGGMFSERSGVVNISLEGTMVMGAFAGTLTIHMLQRSGTMSGMPVLFVGLLVSIITGILYSSLHAIAAINMMADQTISGTALNLFAAAFSIYIARSVLGFQQIPFENQFFIDKVPFFGDLPVIGPMFFQRTYVLNLIGIIILIVAHVVLYKTRFGLRLRSAGEFPQATDAAGISVVKMRYAGVLISGALSGLGGLIYIIPVSTVFDGSVAGYGFLAVAVLIFGQWKPKTVALAALFFGFLKTVSAAYQGIPFLNNLGIPGVVYKILPYLITIVVLFLTSKKSAAPASLGEPFDKGKR